MPEPTSALADSAGQPDNAPLVVELQWQCEQQHNYPTDADIQQWASAAVAAGTTGEVTIRVVDKAEIREANKNWRNKDKPTNVLSFPADFPVQAGINYLGDLLICADVLCEESAQQEKPLHAHWAHITIHGMLHLQGYDHEEEQQAVDMEAREIEILQSFGYNNPYQPQFSESE